MQCWANVDETKLDIDEKSGKRKLRVSNQLVSNDETKLLKTIIDCIDSDAKLRLKSRLTQMMIQDNYEKMGFTASNNIDAHLADFQQQWLLKQVVPILLGKEEFVKKCDIRWILIKLAAKDVGIPICMDLLDCICSTTIVVDRKDSINATLNSEVWNLAIKNQRYEMYVYLFEKYMQHIENGDILSENINGSIVNFFTLYDGEFLKSQKSLVLKFFDILVKNVDTLIINKLHPLQIEL